MIGRIITASTTPAVNMVPPPASDTLPSPKRKNQLRFSLRNRWIGSSQGASTKMPHRPKTIDGTAASRSTRIAKRPGVPARCVVRQERRDADGDRDRDHEGEDRTENGDPEELCDAESHVVSSVVTNSELVMKLALSAASDGTARISRNSPIRAMAPMIVAPAASGNRVEDRVTPSVPPCPSAQIPV